MPLEPSSTQFLSVRQVSRRYGTSIATIWRWCRERPSFPKPIKLSPSCTRWRESDLVGFEKSRESSK